MNILRVDMNSQKIQIESVPEKYQQLSGRAFIVRLLLEEVPPTCDALGPHNKLIFTPGLLGGAGVTAAGRLSVGAKSPLTHGVKEANAGGYCWGYLWKIRYSSSCRRKSAAGQFSLSVTYQNKWRCP